MPFSTDFDNLEEVLAKLKANTDFNRNVTIWKELPPLAAAFAPFPDFISQPLREVLVEQGITALYTHQCEALERSAAGENIVIVTPTASGKTLCYNLPTFQSILENNTARALYLFPTKALAHDQLNEAGILARNLTKKTGVTIKINAYDGDTPISARTTIRKEANIVISNPDMLHSAILPHHTKWHALFTNLKFVVIDELHTYRGVFGSHFSNVIQRLLRICRFYQSAPLFILCSATVANPQEHAQNILRLPTTLIANSGAPRPAKTFIFYNPPIVDYNLGIRQSALAPTRKIAAALVNSGIQTIVFATSRLNVEVLTKYLRDHFSPNGEEGKIAGYRGGYLPAVRREIEAGIRFKKIMGVVSTNALELGIDIGDLDACIICGYPGSIASSWQQAGRAGRKKSQSLAIMIARANPLDQFIIENPDYFFASSPEHCRINPANVLILLSHIKCAAFELPFTDGELFGDNDIGEILEFLSERGVLHREKGMWHWSADYYPAEDINLRCLSSNNVLVIDTSNESVQRSLALVDWTSALSSVHDGAIYICEGQSYFIEHLDTASLKAYARKVDVDYFTEAISQKTIRVENRSDVRYAINTLIERGEVLVSERVIGYKKLRFYTMENLGYGELDLPSLEMRTTAYWFTIAVSALSRMPFSQGEIISGLCGIAYALRHMAAVMLMSEISDIDVVIGDINGEWFIRQGRAGKVVLLNDSDGETLNREDMEPTIFLFDSYPEGIGLSDSLFHNHWELLKRAKKVIENCACKHGCPACVGPSSSDEGTGKETALKIIALLGEGDGTEG